MRNIPHKHRFQVLIIFFGILLFVLAACGPQTSSATIGSGSTMHPTPAPTPTTTGDYGSVHGCPSDTIVSTAPPQANVIIRDTDINSTVSAHVGDSIEVRLPFGRKWSGPVTITSNLEQQQPTGYASAADNACIWRFVAQSAGVAQLDFYMQALCLNGQMCPMFIANMPFTIDVK